MARAGGDVKHGRVIASVCLGFTKHSDTVKGVLAAKKRFAPKQILGILGEWQFRRVRDPLRCLRDSNTGRPFASCRETFCAHKKYNLSSLS